MKRFPVVVTGLGAICSIGRDADEFWSNLIAGRSGLGPLGFPEFADYEAPVAGTVPRSWIHDWQPQSGRSVAAPATQSEIVDRMALIAAEEAVRRSGLQLDRCNLDRVGFVVGVCQPTSRCDAVACFLGLNGPRIVVSTACAAGGHAIAIARDKLWAGEADVVVAGGVDILEVSTYAGFASLQALSKGACAPYSRSDGLTLGEAAAFLVLEPQEAATARGAPMLAEVLGSGMSADAYHPTAPDPTGWGAAAAVRRALADARIEPADINWVNGHGTGTPANDAMERRAMRQIFGAAAGRVPISSLKGAVGHTLGAAGAIEAVASVLAIDQDTIPPTANFAAGVDSDLDFVPNSARRTSVNIVVSNNYAFGGNNVSVVVGKPRPGGRPPEEIPPRRVRLTGIGAIGGPGFGIREWEEALAVGTSTVAEIKSFDAEKYPYRWAAEPPSLDGSSLAHPRIWRHMNPLTRLALAATRSALDDADLRLARDARDSVALIFGTGHGPGHAASKVLSGKGPSLSPTDFSTATMNAAAGAVCQALGLRGPTSTITMGGLSGTVALRCAMDIIATGQASVAVVVAADEFCEFLLAVKSYLSTQPDGDPNDALSPDGTIRPYDQDANGTVLGGGAVALVLEAADHCDTRDAEAYCDVIAARHAGDSASYVRLDPTARRFTEVIRSTFAQASIGPEDVQYCAGSAGGVASVDRIEARALSTILKPEAFIGAPKSVTGDCEAASSLANVLACALAISHGVIAPTLNLKNPIPEFSFANGTGPRRGTRVEHALATSLVPGASFGAVVLGRCRP